MSVPGRSSSESKVIALASPVKREKKEVALAQPKNTETTILNITLLTTFAEKAVNTKDWKFLDKLYHQPNFNEVLKNNKTLFLGLIKGICDAGNCEFLKKVSDHPGFQEILTELVIDIPAFTWLVEIIVSTKDWVLLGRLYTHPNFDEVLNKKKSLFLSLVKGLIDSNDYQVLKGISDHPDFREILEHPIKVKELVPVSIDVRVDADFSCTALQYAVFKRRLYIAAFLITVAQVDVNPRGDFDKQGTLRHALLWNLYHKTVKLYYAHFPEGDRMLVVKSQAWNITAVEALNKDFLGYLYEPAGNALIYFLLKSGVCLHQKETKESLLKELKSHPRYSKEFASVVRLYHLAAIEVYQANPQHARALLEEVCKHSDDEDAIEDARTLLQVVFNILQEKADNQYAALVSEENKAEANKINELKEEQKAKDSSVSPKYNESVASTDVAEETIDPDRLLFMLKPEDQQKYLEALEPKEAKELKETKGAVKTNNQTDHYKNNKYIHYRLVTKDLFEFYQNTYLYWWRSSNRGKKDPAFQSYKDCKEESNDCNMYGIVVSLKKLVDQQKYHQALPQWMHLLFNYKLRNLTAMKVLSGIAQCYAGLGKFDSAITIRKKVFVEFPNDLVSGRNLLEIYNTCYRFDDALEVGQHLLNKFPNDIRVKNQIANLYLELEKYVDAEKLLLAGLDDADLSIEQQHCRRSLLVTFTRTDKFKEGRQLSEKMLETTQDLFSVADFYCHFHLYGQALALLSKVKAQINGLVIKVALMRARIYFEMGSVQKAIALLQEFDSKVQTGLLEETPAFRKMLVYYCGLVGNNELAKENLASLEKHFPEDSSVKMMLAYAEQKRKNYPAAIAIREELNKKSGMRPRNSIGNNVGLAICLKSQGKHEAAAKILNSLPRTKKVNKALSFGHQELKKADAEAKKDISDPRSIEGYLNSIAILSKWKCIKEAIDLCRKGLGEFSYSRDLHLSLAQLLLENGEEDAGIKAHAEVCKTFEYFLEGHVAYVKSLRDLTRYDEALKLINQYLKKFSHSTELYLLKFELYFLLKDKYQEEEFYNINFDLMELCQDEEFFAGNTIFFDKLKKLLGEENYNYYTSSEELPLENDEMNNQEDDEYHSNNETEELHGEDDEGDEDAVREEKADFALSEQPTKAAQSLKLSLSQDQKDPKPFESKRNKPNASTTTKEQPDSVLSEQPKTVTQSSKENVSQDPKPVESKEYKTQIPSLLAETNIAPTPSVQVLPRQQTTYAQPVLSQLNPIYGHPPMLSQPHAFSMPPMMMPQQFFQPQFINHPMSYDCYATSECDFADGGLEPEFMMDHNETPPEDFYQDDDLYQSVQFSSFEFIREDNNNEPKKYFRLSDKEKYLIGFDDQNKVYFYEINGCTYYLDTETVENAYKDWQSSFAQSEPIVQQQPYYVSSQTQILHQMPPQMGPPFPSGLLPQQPPVYPGVMQQQISPQQLSSVTTQHRPPPPGFAPK